MTMLALILFAGCVPEDLLDDAWNAVFQVQETWSDPGCDPPETSVPPFQPFVGVGVAQTLEGIDLASVYWCSDQGTCDGVPFANVQLSVLTTDRISGEFGEVGLLIDSLCRVSWSGVDGTLTPEGEMDLTVRVYSSGSETINDVSECDQLLAAVIGDTCDEAIRISGVRVQ